MNIEEKIKVRVDTRQAKAEVRELHKAKKQGLRRASTVARRGSSLAIRAAGITGAAAAVARFSSSPQASQVDPFEEALVPFWARAQSMIDRKLGSARARASAREQTKSAFTYDVGQRGTSSNLTDFYRTATKLRADVEKGRNILRQDPRFLGPDLKTVSSAALSGYTKLLLQNLWAVNPQRQIRDAVNYFIEGIRR